MSVALDVALFFFLVTQPSGCYSEYEMISTSPRAILSSEEASAAFLHPYSAGGGGAVRNTDGRR